jgi:hypothetical protein
VSDSGFGPFVDGLDVVERTARLRALRALALVTCRPHHVALLAALRLAESGDEGALVEAGARIEELPALPKRRLLALYLDLEREGRN